MTAAYADDLAYIHDAGFGGFAREAGPVLVDALGEARQSPRGWWSTWDAAAAFSPAWSASGGYRTLGIDISEGMVALAREQVPGRRVPGRVALVGGSASMRGGRGRRRVLELPVRSGQHRGRSCVKLFRRIHRRTRTGRGVHSGRGRARARAAARAARGPAWKEKTGRCS